MNSPQLAILLFAAGLILFFGELLLPAHGLLGGFGVVCIAIAIGYCFTINRWLGLGMLAIVALASPFAFMGALNIWPHTPFGKRIVLQPLKSPSPLPLVSIGDVGITVTELRPMGECDFNDRRVEVISELGLIPSGTRIKVVSLSDLRPVVRLFPPVVAERATADIHHSSQI